MSQAPHTERAHASLSPSAASRWFACPGSIRASEGIERKSSLFADEGTAAHTLCEHCLRTGFDADRFIGGAVDIKAGKVFDVMPPKIEGQAGVFAVDDEMAEATQCYLDFIRDEVNFDKHEFEFEQRLDISAVHPGIFGTGDCIAYDPAKQSLLVADFKYGKGIVVDPRENKQLLTYAVGAALRFHNRGLDEITLAVIQPRAEGEAVKTWKLDAVDLLEWRFELAAAAERTDDPDAPLVAGEHCRFCPAAPTCPAIRQKVADIAKVEAAEMLSCLPQPSDYTAADIATVLREAGVVKNWLRAVEAHAHSEALAGRTPEGFKLVAKRASRSWKDEEEAVTALTLIHGLIDSEIHERKVLSPAKVEKIIGKSRKDEIADLIASVSSGLNLVPIEDKRPAAKLSAAEEMEGIIQ